MYFTAGKRELPDAVMLKGPGELDAFMARKTELGTLEGAQRMLAQCDMNTRLAVVIPHLYRDMSEIITAETARQKRRVLEKGIATADNKGYTPRRRTEQSRDLLVECLDKLPQSVYDVVYERAANTVMISGGAHHALGRIAHAFPKAGGRLPPGFLVPTRGEVELSFENCGFPTSVKTLEWEELRINKTSSNGYPLGGTGEDEELLHKAAVLGRNLHRLATEHVRDGGSVAEWVNIVKTDYPHLILLQGKAKADVYTLKKAESFFLRFYNVVPRQFAMLMQTVTQPFEGTQRNILQQRAKEGEFLHSAQGVALAHAGAEDMVEEMDKQLSACGSAFVHCGDDTWLAFKTPSGVVLIGLDASNFDLTQRGEVIEPLRIRLTAALATGDPVAAEIWNEFMRSRLVVVAHTLVREMSHGGPSGMMMQSKLNDMLADIMCTRYVNEVYKQEPVVEEDYERVAIQVGHTLGLDVRLEMCNIVAGAATIREALAQAPFLFLGYYFHVRDERVVVMADMPRSLAGIRYPGGKWEAKKEMLRIKEPMRLGSIVQTWGIPTKEYEAFFDAARKYVVRSVQGALSALKLRGEDDYVDASLRWAVDCAFVGDSTPSMLGLLRALERGNEQLWLDRREAPREVEGTLLGPLAKKGAPMPRLIANPYQLAAGPASRFNDGRPPPTKRWIPEVEWQAMLARRRGWVSEGRALRIGRTRRDRAGGFEFEVDESDYQAWNTDEDASEHMTVLGEHDDYLDEFGDVQVSEDYYDRGDLGGYERAGRYRI